MLFMIMRRGGGGEQHCKNDRRYFEGLLYDFPITAKRLIRNNNQAISPSRAP